MNTIRYFFSEIIGWLLCLFFKSESSNKGILSIYFHNPSYKLFENCIQYLSKLGYRFITIKELLKIYDEKVVITEKLAIITFDDGWQDNLKLVPIIEKYKVFTTIFVVTEAIEIGNFWWEFVLNAIDENSVEALKKIENVKRKKIVAEIQEDLSLKRTALTKQELVQLSKNKYITIGSHLVSHPITINCTTAELQEEYKKSKEILEKWLKCSVTYFAYPNGDYNTRDLELLKSFDYLCAFTTKPGIITHTSEIYELPRYALNSRGGFQENKAKMLGIWQRFFYKK